MLNAFLILLNKVLNSFGLLTMNLKELGENTYLTKSYDVFLDFLKFRKIDLGKKVSRLSKCDYS